MTTSQEALAYATRLAQSIHAKHYSEVTQWKPLPDLMGVLTQIDNMTCGLTRATTSQEAREYPPLPEADAWPLGPAVPFFGPEKMRSYVDADRKARQQEALDAAREALLLFCNDRVLTEFSAGRLRTYWDRRNEVVDKLRAAIAKREPQP